SVALASLGLFGNMIIIIFLSLYLAIDGDRTTAFLNRLVPPRYAEDFALLEDSVSRSFGGFLRGQALIGLVYGLMAAGTSLLLGLDFAALTAVASGVLQAIPFFGPFISWVPPVAVALLTKPEAVIPTLALMIAGWFVVMNVIQPRVMGEAVGIHPAVVLASVVIGAKIAGVAGAIFSVPVAAVLSSIFFYYLNHMASGSRDVTSRAARTVAAREGHPVRVPRPPDATPEAPPDEGSTPVAPAGAATRARARLPRT
ncbi:MAG: AI-2E family transporter, partial [Candidatus Limnocylindrales bacterium]